MQSYPGKYPAIIKAYSAATRQCRVEIPGITDGADEFPLAEIAYPIGDKSRAGDHATELEILVGDPVWVEFIQGDPRRPLITHSRCPQTGNATGTRRYHHGIVEIVADTALRLTVGGVTVEITASGVAGSGGGLTWRGKTIDDTHTHGNVQAGSGTSGPPT